MAIELRQQVKLAQQLVMTPQLQQAIKLLQLSRVELIDAIRQEIETNPVLDVVEADEPMAAGEIGAEAAEGTEAWDADQALSTLASSDQEKMPWEERALAETDWREMWEEDRRVAIQSYSYEEKELPDYDNFLSKSPGLADQLLWQLRLSRFEGKEREIGELIIGNLDPDGYLRVDLADIARDVGCDPETAEKVLERIQFFDPVGVAARDLRECLFIQIRHYRIQDPLVQEIVSSHLHLMERHQYQLIAKATGRDIAEVLAAVQVIVHLDPKPGRAYGNEETHYIVPDLYVTKIGDDYVVTLNDEGIPHLKISSYWREAQDRGLVGDDARQYIQEKLKSATWLMKSICQRQKTIQKVATSIFSFQKEFLDKGIFYLKPLILRDVAEDVGMHESTISRVTTNKYVHTPQGIFELKYFFGFGLARENGADIASHTVKERIKQIIQSEDVAHPYKDSQIAEILAKEDIRIARRTVAKYREQLRILPTSRRKRPDVALIRKTHPEEKETSDRGAL